MTATRTAPPPPPPPTPSGSLLLHPGPGFQLVDSEGRPVGQVWTSRGDAVRHMGTVALHGASLPLKVRRPDGRLTGDQLG